MSIQNILDRKTAEVFAIRPTETIRTAAQLMQAHGIGALVVRTGDIISGLISERDIVHAISQHGERALFMTTLDVMTRNAVTVTPDDSLKRATSLMTGHRLRHLTVIAAGKLIGIVSIGDVVKTRMEELESEHEQLQSYITQG